MKIKTMVKSMVLLVLLLTTFFCTTQKENPEVEQKIRNIENGILEIEIGTQGIKQTRKKSTLSERLTFYKIPGLSMAVVKGNNIEWTKTYGTLNVESGAPITTESIFQAASTSKMITAVLILHFVEKGKLDLDEDVNTYLKSWKIPENEFTRDKKVTMRLLLTHKSGLPITNFGYDEKIGIPSLVQVLKGESPAQNKAALVEFVPGTKWQYSNIGYDVLQLVLEDVVGKPFAQIARESLFEPLGMKSSTFVYPLKTELQAKEAMPHDDKGAVGEPAMHQTALAHGGLMTTPSDLAKFVIELMKAYQGESHRVLYQNMVKQLLKKELELDPEMFGFPLGEGLGVFLFGKGQDFSFGHPGSNLPGTTSWLIGWPDSGNAVIIMANGFRGDLLSMEILSTISSEYNWPAILKL